MTRFLAETERVSLDEKRWGLAGPTLSAKTDGNVPMTACKTAQIWLTVILSLNR